MRKRFWWLMVLMDSVLFWGAVMALVFFLLCSMSSCASRKVVDTTVVTKTVHDTTYVSKLQKDSVYFRDSIFVQADTEGKVVYQERWHTRYIERLKTDTLYREHEATRDSVRAVVETKEITRNSGFARFCIWIFWIVVAAAALRIAWKIWGAKLKAII